MANKDLKNQAYNTHQNIAQNEYNNYMINRIAYGGPLFNHAGDWSNEEYLETIKLFNFSFSFLNFSTNAIDKTSSIS